MSVDVADPDLPRWVRGGVATVYGVLAILVAFLSGIAVAGFGRSFLLGVGALAEGTPESAAVFTALQFVGFILGMAILLHAIQRRDLLDGRVRVPTLRDAGWTAAGLLVLFTVSIGLGALLSAFGVEVARNRVIERGMETPRLFLLMIPVTVLFVATGEELVFRGVVQGLFRRALGPAAAVAVASLLFGVSHWLALVGTGGGRLAYVLIAAVLGLILGTVYETTDNLVVPILVHGLYNGIRFFVGYLEATGLM